MRFFEGDEFAVNPAIAPRRSAVTASPRSKSESRDHDRIVSGRIPQGHEPVRGLANRYEMVAFTSNSKRTGAE